MKRIELKLISELMKNSRRNDRELAKAIGVSTPTLAKMIRKLEKEGIIREYTIIPDFAKLGYDIMGITFVKVEPKTEEGFSEIRKATIEAEKKNPHAGLMIANVVGSEKNRVFIDFYQDYTAYTRVVEQVKRFPFTNVESVETAMINMKDKENYRTLSMREIANHLQSMSTPE